MIKRHFPPPTFRSHFSPERAFPPPPFAFRTTFPPEGLAFPDTPPNETPTLEAAHILGPPYSPSQRNDNGQSGLIPKPKGEVNRTDTYNLKKLCEEQLGWNATHFEEIQKYLHKLVDTNLDKEFSRTQQTMEMRRLVYDEATKMVPTLKRGDSLHGGVDQNWVLNDFVALRLKYWKHPDRQRPKVTKPTNNDANTSTTLADKP